MSRYTPAFIAAARRLYLETDQSLSSIAWDLGISLRTFRRLIDSEGWPKRPQPPPRDLSPAAKLLEQAIALERAYEQQQRRR
jgi:transposase-like protein